MKQGTSLVKNSLQTVKIKDKTNEKKPYLEQNISNHKLDGSDKKANTNTSPEMKISCNVKKGTSLVKNSSQTVEIKDKKICQQTQSNSSALSLLASLLGF